MPPSRTPHSLMLSCTCSCTVNFYFIYNDHDIISITHYRLDPPPTQAYIPKHTYALIFLEYHNPHS